MPSNGPAAILRIHRIHTLLSSGRRVSCPSLASDLEVSDRTIRRDIDTLRYLGAPLEWDPSGKTYFSTLWTHDDHFKDLPHVRFLQKPKL